VETLERNAPLDVDLLHLQLSTSARRVLGVGDRRLEHLLDDPSTFLRAEHQQVERLLDGQPANLVGYQPPLLG